MNSKSIKILLSVLLIAILFMSNAFAEGDGRKGNTINKPMGTPVRAYMNINSISTVIKNTGISDIDQFEANSGLVYPIGSGKTAVFASGFLWGAILNDIDEEDPHVGGSTYREGLQGGWIDAAGNVIPPDDPRSRIYRVRPNVFSGGPVVDLSIEAADEGKSENDVRSQYEIDWTEWPADIGAPYTDVDDNGTYDPTIDVPGVPGADQTIWYVANDWEPGVTQNLYGALPMGVEMQATFWAYAQTGALGSMFFRRYILINKTDVLGDPRTFDSMYVSMWSDVDLGNASDDFAGSDTTLSLTYVYNGQANDATYNPLPPPSVGFDFFQGPIVPSPGDSAIFKGKRIYGYKNLPMTAAYYFTRGDATVTDPVLGSHPEGAVRFYRFMKGRVGLTGGPFVNPVTGLPTPFTLSGDPTTGEGWVDGMLQAPGDRRIGEASGPFTMSPGDTQEVVIAEIVAGAIPGVDRISSIALLKFYDQIAQVAYDNFFDLPTPPPAPSVTVAELDKEIVLDWSKDNSRVLATETSNIKEYTFQGYNVYQLPSSSASVSEGKRIATFDIIDGVGKINDLVFDPTTGSVVLLPVQFGNDTGIKRFISIKQDAINERPLINGIRYYFAVTAYNYNSDPQAVPNNLENPIATMTIIPQSNAPGITYGESNGFELEMAHTGTADGVVSATIVDPTVTKGNNYEIFFSLQDQIRDANGDWIAAGSVNRFHRPNDPDTLTGSSISIAAVYAPTGGVVQLNCHYNYVSPDFNWADGIRMKFPAGMTVLSVPVFEAGGGTVTPEIIAYGDSTIVNMGLVNHEYTGNGIFHGEEDFVIFVASFTPPQSVGWTIFDDNYSGGPVDASGTTSIDAIGNESRTAEHWNLRNTTIGDIVLQNQSVYNGLDRWPPRDDLPPSSINLGPDAMPVADGFQVNLDVNFAAPINYFSLTLVDDPTGTTTLTRSSSTTTLDIQNYTIFSGTISSKAIDNFGVGTNELASLQQDYELRFTGVYTETSPGIFEVTSGGQIATIFRMVNAAALANHPLNPNPGTAAPFLIRIPFEVWNVDDPENPYQVNLTFRDRERNGTETPFYAWNPSNRMYAIIVNSPYDENQVIQVDGGPDPFNDPATWIIVMYGTNYGLNARVSLTYANPIVVGGDTYSFSSVASAYSIDLAKNQINEINVFPNPYYGVNSEELNKYNRFVTFTHLPENARIRIFNLSGVLVKNIEKEDLGQFLRWDLANQDGLPVASGLYIAYIELPDLGLTKILKLAIIQEQQILDRF